MAPGPIFHRHPPGRRCPAYVYSGMGMPYEKVAMLVAVVCAVLFTVLLGNNFIEEAPVAVIDLDNSKYSHELIQEMDASPYIDINTVLQRRLPDGPDHHRQPRFVGIKENPPGQRQQLCPPAQSGSDFDYEVITTNLKRKKRSCHIKQHLLGVMAPLCLSAD